MIRTIDDAARALLVANPTFFRDGIGKILFLPISASFAAFSASVTVQHLQWRATLYRNLGRQFFTVEAALNCRLTFEDFLVDAFGAICPLEKRAPNPASGEATLRDGSQWRKPEGVISK